MLPIFISFEGYSGLFLLSLKTAVRFTGQLF